MKHWTQGHVKFFPLVLPYRHKLFSFLFGNLAFLGTEYYFSKRKCHSLVVVQVHLVHLCNAGSLSSPVHCILVLLSEKVCRKALGSMALILEALPMGTLSNHSAQRQDSLFPWPPFTTGWALFLPWGPSLVTAPTAMLHRGVRDGIFQKHLCHQEQKCYMDLSHRHSSDSCEPLDQSPFRQTLFIV